MLLFWECFRSASATPALSGNCPSQPLQASLCAHLTMEHFKHGSTPTPCDQLSTAHRAAWAALGSQTKSGIRNLREISPPPSPLPAAGLVARSHWQPELPRPAFHNSIKLASDDIVSRRPPQPTPPPSVLFSFRLGVLLEFSAQCRTSFSRFNFDSSRFCGAFAAGLSRSCRNSCTRTPNSLLTAWPRQLGNLQLRQTARRQALRSEQLP